MHDIWNPWHGCMKISEGCRYCYMYTMDRYNGHNGAEIRRNKAGFDAPLQRDRSGAYRIKSGETVRVCMTSDFFLEEADPWREEAWSIIRQRKDVRFFLLTKRAHRIAACLPPDWGDGWENVIYERDLRESAACRRACAPAAVRAGKTQGHYVRAVHRCG